MILDKPIEGVRTDARPHPAGREGSLLSLREVAERAWKARMSLRLRAWVTQTIDRAGASRGSRRQKAEAVLKEYRRKVPYVNDPVMGETMATPEQTLCLDEGGLCIIGGDCFPVWTPLLVLPDGIALGGTLRPIEHVEPGMIVWGWNAPTDVLSVTDKGTLPLDLLSLEGGGSLLLTADHHVYLHSDSDADLTAPPPRVRVRDLRGGERLIVPDSDPTGQGRVPLGGELAGGRLVERVARAVATARCRDITTASGYVYLPEHDVTVSNCDDAAIVLIASMLCIGIPAVAIGSSHRAPYDTPTHVFMAFQDEQGDWVRMDGTTNHPIGQTAKHQREWWVEPGEQAKVDGEGDFVGMSGSVREAGVGSPSTASRIDALYPWLK